LQLLLAKLKEEMNLKLLQNSHPVQRSLSRIYSTQYAYCHEPINNLADTKTGHRTLIGNKTNILPANSKPWYPDTGGIYGLN
jgi:hypothetical protein